ncbi:Conserved_hypothetical protein [Hexamita inflata]|uniref:Uncharacterized protein n=1 Tax=Hexamita inflata TaxID=28002 RepID=A0AA86NXZ6_9EUKA|nr:Conserved hypothetical protein [Hexamita inflata]
MITFLVESAVMLKVVICIPISNKISEHTYNSQICRNKVQRNSQDINYCIKEYSLSSRVQSASITQSPASAVHLSLYTTATQNLILNLTYSMQNLPSFSLFGLTNAISLQSSNISVSIPQDLSQGSLLCLACDVTANASDFTFVASGKNVSGAVLTPLTTFQLNQSLVQFRLNGVNVGGLVLNASKIAVTISICNISGNVGNQSVSGSIICFVFEQVSLGVDNVRICANVQNIGQGSLSQTGTVMDTCVVCREGSPAYGLCQKSLEFGKVEDDEFVCPLPFVFDGEGCSCQEGYVVNGTTCVNVLASVNSLKSQQIDINNSIADLSNRTKMLENTTGILNASQEQMKLDIQSMYLLNNQTQNNIISNSSQLQQFILGNYSIAENNLQANTTVLDKRIFNNVTVLNNQISALNATSLALNQNITQLNQTLNAQKQLNVLLTQNITQLNDSLISSNQIIQQQQQIIGDLNLQVWCLNQRYLFYNYQCITNYSITCQNPSLSCSQQLFISIFDLPSITHQVMSSNNSYVFSTTITNAFIDVSNNVFSSIVNPLFQSQSTFTNLKIQFGAQTLNSGSFISTQNSQITINQMNIISRPGSQLTVTANSQLNIISSSPTGAVINNLLVNLSFTLSTGNITLINNINGVFNISGYQVLGDYSSTLTVAMIGINVQTATINLNQVSFKPNTYNVGNGSSYLFGNSVSGASSFAINNLAIIIGNSSNFLLLGSISTTTYDTNYYLFGGIIAYINTTSSINVNSVIIDSYQKFSTSYVTYSGFLVGYVESSSSNVTIKNVCLQQNMTSTTLQFRCFGLIGINKGNTSIQNASVTFSFHGAVLRCFGILGLQDSSSLYAEVINLITSVRVSSSGGDTVSSVFGWEGAKNSSVQNVSVVGGNVSGSNEVGGIIGYINFNATIMNSSVQSSNVSGSSYVGGIIGFQNSNSNTTILDSSVQNSNVSGSRYNVGGIIGRCSSKFYLTNVQIMSARITGSSSLGVVVGWNDGGMYSFITSTASSNYINGTKQTDCASLLNSKPNSGC